MLKKIIFLSALSLFSLAAGAQSSLWLFTKERIPEVEASWCGAGHCVAATDYGNGTVTLTREDAQSQLKYYMKKKSPCVDGLRAGDAWEFSLPVKNLPAGSCVELDLSLVSEEASPRYYIFEYLDGGEWKTMPSDLRREDGVDFSFKCFGYVTTPSYQYTTALQTVRLENAIDDGEVKIRARVAADIDCLGRRLDPAAEKCCTRIEWGDNVGAYMHVLGNATPRDTTNVLCIGNSFTYVQGASWMLKEMAWTQGHYLNLKAALKGGQTYGQHLELSTTDDAIRIGGYDVVFLQNQSQTHAWYAQDPKGKDQIRKDAVTLVSRVRGWSPDARVVLESTWSYPGVEFGGFGSLKNFDKLLEKGSKALCKATDAEMSPIGRAYALSRELYPDIPLYAADDKHQSVYGAYLKACVNYLLIFGEPFGEGVSDCNLEAGTAAKLRSVASKIIKTK